ncbi:MAG: DUF5991 domain-containing protein [Gammaproteobacteria bacterium]|jgi:hypothetical protein
MISIRAAILSLAVTTSACMAGSSVSDWVGQYKYEASAGETVGGSAIITELQLNIGKDDAKNPCLLQETGYQLNETIVCSYSANNNQLTIHFKSYPNGKIVNQFDVAEYKVGETLFSIEKKMEGPKPERYTIIWGSFSPYETMPEKSDDYFKKVK